MIKNEIIDKKPVVKHRTLDIKPQNNQKNEKKIVNKVPPAKKKIIKFHFANPYEYKMFFF